MAANISNDSQAIYDLLTKAKTIALVGHSANPEKDSYRVAEYLRGVGYTVIPVNPTTDEIDGRKSYPSLRNVPGEIDLVDVFRGTRHIPGIVDDAIAVGAKAVWTQLDLEHEAAAEKAIANGIDVVMNRCTKIEHARLRVGQV
ncbi:MAG: CoA-binding protein [Chloroflexota bacterium]